MMQHALQIDEDLERQLREIEGEHDASLRAQERAIRGSLVADLESVGEEEKKQIEDD